MADFKDPSPTSTLETRSLSNSPPAGNGRGAAAPTDDTRSSLADSDEAVLARLGYKQEFVREFTNLSVSPFAPVPVRQAAPPFFSHGLLRVLIATSRADLRSYHVLQTISFAFSIMGCVSDPGGRAETGNPRTTFSNLRQTTALTQGDAYTVSLRRSCRRSRPHSCLEDQLLSSGVGSS